MKYRVLHKPSKQDDMEDALISGSMVSSEELRINDNILISKQFQGYRLGTASLSDPSFSRIKLQRTTELLEIKTIDGLKKHYSLIIYQ